MNDLLETEGLISALQDFSRRLGQTASFQVHLETDPVPPLTEKAGPAILSVIEEAAGNAKAHAQADNLWITVRCLEDKLQVCVSDDGRGFDLEALQSTYKARGIDPAYDMRSRLEAIQGELMLHSAIGEGTTYCVIVPLSSIAS